MNENYRYIILDELNIKAVDFIDDASSLISYKFKPQMRTMGPKYGKLMRPIFDEIAKMDGAEVMAVLNSGEPLRLVVDGTDVEVGKDDVLIETTQKDGLVSDSDNGYTVILDTNLTDELIEEGFVREILSKLQTMRKDSGFEVQDKIAVKYSASDKIKNIIENNTDEIASQALANSITFAENNGKEWNINGEKVVIEVVKD